jgi:CheY-like chemotaxis protein
MPQARATRSPHALVVEQHAGMRVFLAGVARTVGLEVVEAASGEAALEAFSKYTFDLVVLDLVLPGMDGYALIDAILARTVDRDRPRLIVCSTLVNLDQPLQRPELEDVDVLLPVPTTAIDLIEAIRSALALRSNFA